MKKIIDRTVAPILALPRQAKRAIALTIDFSLCILTVWIAYYLRLGVWVSLSDYGWQAALVAGVLAPAVFIPFGLYRSVFRYVSWDALISTVQAHVVYGLIYSAIFTAWGINGVPRTVGLIQPVLLFIAVGATRVLGRYWLGGMYRRLFRSPSVRNVLIYGAGSAGRQLADALHHSDSQVVGFIDDAPNLAGTSILGKRVFPPSRLASLIDDLNVDEIFLAIPSSTRERRNQILKVLRETGAAVRTLPGLLDLASGKVSVSDLRPLSIEDLLGRDVVDGDHGLLERKFHDEVVLVTGAGGSIGSELCRQIFALKPRVLILVEASEFALYSIHRELERIGQASPSTELVPILGSVTDRARMHAVFAAFRPGIVYHAAAYKHVPLVEQNILEGMRNNVLGTLVCAQVAREVGVRRFVLISTDKAVRPTNVMGATKRMAELVIQALAAEPDGETRYSMVRFGNVLGSSGSVVPLFRQQIAAGGPVTVTHREVIRYFMTIPEAAQLVLHADALSTGGEVFVLDMGEPVKVYNLAVRMIELSGLKVRDEDNPAGDIEIAFSGLRPGEKLYEELLIGADPVATSHPRIMMASEGFLPMAELAPKLEALAIACSNQNVSAGLALLRELVPEYTPEPKLVDAVHLRQEGPSANPMLSIVSG